MAGVCRWLLICVLCAASRLWAAGGAEEHAFEAARKAFDDAFYDRAQGEFAAFLQKYPTSIHLPEAVLYQANARIKQGNYDGAIELLTARQNIAGAWADRYVFSLADAQTRKGDYTAGAESFARLSREFPASPLLLESTIGEAGARAKLSNQWARVTELLQRSNSVFLAAARTNAAHELVPRGYLLLGEALLAQANYPAAEAALEPMAKLPLKPLVNWQRQYLLCRIQSAAGRVESALTNAAGLPALAAAVGDSTLLADSTAFQAALLERVGLLDQAIAAYTNNLAATVPAARRSEALLKVSQLYLRQNRNAEASENLETLLRLYPDDPAAAVALLSLGELHLRGSAASLGTNTLATLPGPSSVALTNGLQRAVTALQTLGSRFPQSPLIGKANLDLGWCYWYWARWPESQAAFQLAVQQLPPSLDQATAYFKLADVQFTRGDFTNATRNYNAVADLSAAVPELKTNFLEQALYQVVRAAEASSDVAAATNAVAKLLAGYPEGFYTDRAVLLAGQGMRAGNPARARELFTAFEKLAPHAALQAEVQLAIIRTYEEERQWTNALTRYETWLATYTNHPALARASYSRALVSYYAGFNTNALNQFTNFIARFPTNEFAPLAALWVADYYLTSGDAKNAEITYKFLLDTNLPPKLTYEARLSAGRAAYARLNPVDAIRWFTNLTSDLSCPVDLRVQALFAYGDTLLSISSDETNRVTDLKTATEIFRTIYEQYPTNRLAVLAWGQRAFGLLQYAKVATNAAAYVDATNALTQVIDATNANAKARSIAQVGLGVALEKLAERSATGQAELYTAALNRYLDVLYAKNLRPGEAPDPYWTKEAGVQAVRLSESLKLWSQAANLLQRMGELLPPMRAQFEAKRNKILENLKTSAAPGASASKP